jgi:hypothetical protein
MDRAGQRIAVIGEDALDIEAHCRCGNGRQCDDKSKREGEKFGGH